MATTPEKRKAMVSLTPDTVIPAAMTLTSTVISAATLCYADTIYNASVKCRAPYHPWYSHWSLVFFHCFFRLMMWIAILVNFLHYVVKPAFPGAPDVKKHSAKLYAWTTSDIWLKSTGLPRIPQREGPGEASDSGIQRASRSLNSNWKPYDSKSSMQTHIRNDAVDQVPKAIRILVKHWLGLPGCWNGNMLAVWFTEIATPSLVLAFRVSIIFFITSAVDIFIDRIAHGIRKRKSVIAQSNSDEKNVGLINKPSSNVNA